MGKNKKDKGPDAQATTLGTKASDALRRKCPAEAIEYLDQALKERPGNQALHVSLLLNRAQANVALGRHGSGLADAEAAIALEPSNAQALCCCGECEDALGMYSSAADTFSHALTVCTEAGIKEQCDRGLQDARRHLSEQTTGAYQWADLYKADASSSSSVPDDLRTASYCHSSLRIQLTAEHGRGLVINQDVDEGTLLFASKAFAMAPRAELPKVVLSKLQTCPQVDYDRFFCLYDGTNSAKAVPVALNLEGRPSDEAPGINASSRDVDKKRLDRILGFNTYARDVLNEYGACEESSRCGIWILPTFLNHSCCPNVQRIFVGDMMMCRAARPLKSGTELCDAYVSTFQPLHIRQERVKADFGVSCRCSRCIIEEAVLPGEVARPLVNQLDKIVDQIDLSDLAKSAAAFDSLASSVGSTVASAVDQLWDKEKANGKLREACLEICGPPKEKTRWAARLQRLLCGSFIPVFKGAAFVRKQLSEHARCAQQYGICLSFLDEVMPGSAYQAHWASECALQAHRAWQAAADRDRDSLREVLVQSVQDARRLNRICYGAEAFQGVMERFGLPAELFRLVDELLAKSEADKKGDKAAAIDTAQPIEVEAPEPAPEPSAHWEHSVAAEEGRFIVSVGVPEGVEPSDLDLDVGVRHVLASCREGVCKLEPLRIHLTKDVDPDRAPPAKYKKKVRRLVLELPLA